MRNERLYIYTPCTTKELGIFYGLSSFNYLASADESVSPDAWNIEIAHSEFVFFFFFLLFDSQ